MTPCERIKRTLDFKIPDRIGIYDCLEAETQISWKEKKYIPENLTYQEFFNYDLALFELNKFSQDEYKKAKDKAIFLTLAVSDPFQQAVNDKGLEGLLMCLAQDPKKAKDLFSSNTEKILQSCQLLLDKGLTFDGAWVWADLAYKTGCYFSVDTYKRLLYPYHAEIFNFFNSNKLPVIFHSDGNISAFIPLLLKAGIRALNPLEADCGFDIESLKKEYGRDLVIFGNMPTLALEKDTGRIEGIFAGRIETAKYGGGFIYHGDKPIPPTVSFKNYKFALKIVKKYGSY